MASGRRGKGRDINGILLLDKVTGISSNTALQQIKRLFRANKAGHTGSLDPLASGLLPICLGEATKMSQFLLDADKRYFVEATLGVTTTTGDAEGDIVSTEPVRAYAKDEILRVLQRFLGESDQIPPMHSAIKKDGVPLYKLAHQGIEIEREARKITIHSLELIDYNNDLLHLDVACSKGTYIRTLVEDIGKALGCGAHVSGLRRLKVGAFDIKNAVTLSELEGTLADSGLDAIDGRLLPVEAALESWPQVSLSADAAFYLRQGQPVLVPKAPTRGWVRLFYNTDQFLGVGEIIDDGRVAPRRLLRTD